MNYFVPWHRKEEITSSCRYGTKLVAVCLPSLKLILLVGIRFDWRAYMLLFQCFYNSPSSRIHEAIDAYHEYRQSASPSKFGQGVSIVLYILTIGCCEDSFRFDP
jgi:hypothetical protein